MALSLNQIASSIPDGTLCLTFDDGPGPHTADISSYLHSEQISATFFLIGRYVAARRAIVQQLLDDGHEIGNHSFSHPALTNLDEIEVGPEISAAHEFLRSHVGNDREKPLFFRAPFGRWPALRTINDERTPGGERLGDIYVGPVNWDFTGDDWWHWQGANSASDPHALRNAVNQYLPARRGIVLMHDHSQDPQIAGQVQTCAMLKQLVPAWKAQGFSFISLREAYAAGYLDVPV